MRLAILFLFSILMFSACQTVEPAKIASADAKRFPLKGKIVSVDRAKKQATIDHEEIPGYMEAMTMRFPIREDYILETMSKDAEIRAELVVDKGEYWLENIILTAAPTANQPAPPPANENFAQIGQPAPDFKLTNQDGKTISLADFRGKALAITFIYARCPLPEYCIAMSENFSDVANELRNSEAKDKIRLLSISFDPANDTPEKLRQYGTGYLGKNAEPDFTVWQLATGTDSEVRRIADFFGLRYELDENNKTQFNHSLRTIVITHDGKVQKIFSGSEWTTSELIRELQASAK